jgi:hypothetical protein
MGKHLGLKSVMHFLEKKFPESTDIIESLIGFAADFSGDVGIREDISVITLRID